MCKFRNYKEGLPKILTHSEIIIILSNDKMVYRYLELTLCLMCSALCFDTKCPKSTLLRTLQYPQKRNRINVRKYIKNIYGRSFYSRHFCERI